MGIERTFRHVGYVVEDLAAAIADFQRLFDLTDDDVVVTPPADVASDTRFGFFTVGGMTFELIQPVTDRFRDVLDASGHGINHVCFTVDDLDAAVADLAAKGVRPGHVTPDGPIEMPHQRMCYFDPATTGGILLEYIQPR